MSLGSKAIHNMMGRNGMHGEYAMTEIRRPCGNPWSWVAEQMLCNVSPFLYLNISQRMWVVEKSPWFWLITWRAHIVNFEWQCRRSWLLLPKTQQCLVCKAYQGVVKVLCTWLSIIQSTLTRPCWQVEAHVLSSSTKTKVISTRCLFDWRWRNDIWCYSYSILLQS